MLNVLRQEHKLLLDLLDECKKKKKGDKYRLNAWRDLRRQLTRHSMLEEEVVYPALKQKKLTRSLAGRAAVHHSTMDRMVNTLEKVPVGCERWEEVLEQLRLVVIHHIELEEAELHVLIPKVFNSKEITVLKGRLKITVAA